MTTSVSDESSSVNPTTTTTTTSTTTSTTTPTRPTTIPINVPVMGSIGEAHTPSPNGNHRSTIVIESQPRRRVSIVSEEPVLGYDNPAFDQNHARKISQVSYVIEDRSTAANLMIAFVKLALWPAASRIWILVTILSTRTCIFRMTAFIMMPLIVSSVDRCDQVIAQLRGILSLFN